MNSCLKQGLSYYSSFELDFALKAEFVKQGTYSSSDIDYNVFMCEAKLNLLFFIHLTLTLILKALCVEQGWR